MDRDALLRELCHYRSPFPEEEAYARRGCQALRFSEGCYHREGPGLHVTASTWVINPGGTATLLLLHRKIGGWFQPGGHADGEKNVLQVAIRECCEETGLPQSALRVLTPRIFDVDIHRVPERRREPEHHHLDIRFLLETDDRLPLQGNLESLEIRWVPLHGVRVYNHSRSLHRLVAKTREWLRQQRRGHTQA